MKTNNGQICHKLISNRMNTDVPLITKYALRRFSFGINIDLMTRTFYDVINSLIDEFVAIHNNFTTHYPLFYSVHKKKF